MKASLKIAIISARERWSAICLRPLWGSIKKKQYLVIHKTIKKHGNFKYSCDKCDLQARNGGKLKGHQKCKNEAVWVILAWGQFQFVQEKSLLRVYKITTHKNKTEYVNIIPSNHKLWPLLTWIWYLQNVNNTGRMGKTNKMSILIIFIIITK